MLRKSGSPKFLVLITLFLFFKVKLCVHRNPNQNFLGKLQSGYRISENNFNRATNGKIFTTATKLIFGRSVKVDPVKEFPLPFKSRLLPVPIADIKHYLHFAAAACYDKSTLFKFKCSECKLTGPRVRVLDVVQNKTMHTYGYIALDSVRNEIIVTFLGTYGPRNLLNDFRFDMARSPLHDGAYLHRGFYEATTSIYGKISKTVKWAHRKYPNYRVVFTGHSTGGAMATITYYFLSSELPDVNYTVVTFGKPREGDRRFADIINSRAIPSARVVNQDDFAPHFIPYSMGFVHTQTEYWILSPPRIRICSNTVYEDTSCSASLKPKQLLLADHLRYMGSAFSFNCILDNPLRSVYRILRS